MTKRKADPDDAEGQPPRKKAKPTPPNTGLPRPRRFSAYLGPVYLTICKKRAAVVLPLPNGKPADAFCRTRWETAEIQHAFGHWDHQLV